jgi:hypothetical protein
VKSQYNTFRGVNWKILRLSKVLLQFTEKGGDDCFDVIHGFVENDIKHICMAYSQGAEKTGILKEYHSRSFRVKYLVLFLLLIDRNKCLWLMSRSSLHQSNSRIVGA